MARTRRRSFTWSIAPVAAAFLAAGAGPSRADHLSEQMAYNAARLSALASQLDAMCQRGDQSACQRLQSIRAGLGDALRFGCSVTQSLGIAPPDCAGYLPPAAHGTRYPSFGSPYR